MPFNARSSILDDSDLGDAGSVDRAMARQVFCACRLASFFSRFVPLKIKGIWYLIAWPSTASGVHRLDLRMGLGHPVTVLLTSEY